MTPRLLAAALALGLLAGCSWDDRPDGGDPLHQGEDDFARDLDGRALQRDAAEADPFDPYDAEALPSVSEAPVPLPQPVPTTGSADATSEIEEALTPGTER